MDRIDLPPSELRVDVHRTICDISRTEWDSCFPGDPEGWAYYRALEQSALTAFSRVYFCAREGDRVAAVAPAFVTDYSLDTTIQGGSKRILGLLLRKLRSRLTLRLLCLGGPLSDRCHLGFAPDLRAGRRGELLSRLLAQVDAFAAEQGIGLVAAKDVAHADLEPGVGAAFAAAGFARQPSLPNAVLSLPRGSEDAYLGSLSRATRREVRRKLRNLDLVRVERRRGTEALEWVPEMVRLYEAQRERSPGDFGPFETLTPEYFRRVLLELGKAAVVFLYWHMERPVAFNLCYHTGRLFVDKFIGFEQPAARELDLYVVSWMTNVRYCLVQGIPLLQTGQTAYDMKLHLGSELQPNWIFFRHRNPILNSALRLAAPLLAPEAADDRARASGGFA